MKSSNVQTFKGSTSEISLSPHLAKRETGGFFRFAGILLILTVFFILLFPIDAHAGQLVISAVFGAIGAYFGGPLGFTIGWAIGSLIGGQIFPPSSPTIRGPRLSDKAVQSAAFGTPVTKHWGTDRLPAQIVFCSDLKETSHKIQAGKGMSGGSQSTVTYTYAVDIMLSFGRRAKGVLRIWADTKLIYDATGEADLKKLWAKEGNKFIVRDGNESQLPSALEESYHGVGLCSAHRGLFCLEAEDFQLANFANRIPNFTAEVFTEGESSFGKLGAYTPPNPPYSSWKHSVGYIDPNGEVWALYHPASAPFWYPGYSTIFHWTLDAPSDPVEEFNSLWDGVYVQQASTASSIRLRSDEHGAAVYGTGGLPTYFALEQGTQIHLVDAHGSPELMVKYDNQIYLVGGNAGLYLGPDPHHLELFDSGGVKQTETDLLNTEGGGQDVLDMGRSESYLWALFQNKILKIDPDDLSLISQIDISSITDFVLAMAVISDTEIRLAAGSALGGTQFYVISNEGAPVLDQSASENYSATGFFGKFGLHYQNGIYMLDFAGYVGGFAAFIDFFGPGGNSEDIPLWKIVRDINIMAGLDSVIDSAPPTVGDIEVSELLDLVHGYSLTRGMSAREALVQLQLCYFFDCREKDLKLDYPKRGHAAVKSLPGADLAARSSLTEDLPDRLTQTRMRETELPLRVHVIYNNFEGSYQPGHEYAPRLVTDAKSTQTVEIAVAITSTKARQIADTLLALAWLERESFQLRASRKHMRIDAADNIEVVITEE